MRIVRTVSFLLAFMCGWALLATPTLAAVQTDAAVKPGQTMEGQPLLPEPPKHGYVPMQPLVPDASADAPEGVSPHLGEYGGQLSMYAAEMAFYAGIMAFSLKGLWVMGCLALFALLAIFLSIRRIALHAGNVATAARISAECAREQVELDRETAVKKLRAYVFTNGAKGEVLASKHFHVRIEVKNTGLTPAYRLNGWMGVYIDDLANERQSPPTPLDFQAVETILPPGGVCFYYAQTAYPVAGDLKFIQASQKAIFAYGEIRYADVFGHEHTMRFKVKCAGERNVATGSFDHCMQGNEAD